MGGVGRGRGVAVGSEEARRAVLRVEVGALLGVVGVEEDGAVGSRDGGLVVAGALGDELKVDDDVLRRLESLRVDAEDARLLVRRAVEHACRRVEGARVVEAVVREIDGGDAVGASKLEGRQEDGGVVRGIDDEGVGPDDGEGRRNQLAGRRRLINVHVGPVGPGHSRCIDEEADVDVAVRRTNFHHGIVPGVQDADGHVLCAVEVTRRRVDFTRLFRVGAGHVGSHVHLPQHELRQRHAEVVGVVPKFRRRFLLRIHL
mmetsp:Transcript_2116/g.7147  ORF Transcript_2116/g.7147 Transcript_2116/m.7147 type:complete len:259 (+) Transcript_2116:842-1618(+)